MSGFRRKTAFERKIVIIISGDDAETRAKALCSLSPEQFASLGNIDLSDPRHRVRLRIIITDARRPTSVRDALSYVVSEVRDGIGEAGGTLSDGTHVQISTL